MVFYISSYYSVYAWANGLYGPWIAQVATYVPPGSCVVYSRSPTESYANRFYTTDPNCPVVVDPYGMWMKFGYKVVPPTQTFANQWKSYFKDAQYVVLSGPNDPNIPWTNGLRAYFDDHFQLDLGKNYVYIYRQVRPHEASSPARVPHVIKRRLLDESLWLERVHNPR